ncbi:MAG TPA: putative collagen-binding domain-containing protein, partial [Kofleriaceae bacterium]|nr:putative collagen-binding domain-containing protein [Kofleriaceae bacterium]
PVGMTSTYTKDNPNADSDTDLYASGAEWISPKTQLADGDGRKVVLNDTDHSFGWEQLQSAGALGQRQWAWETFCRGAAPVFMDPYLEAWTGRNSPSGTTPDPQWNGLRDALGYTALFASKIDLEQAVPSTSLCSTTYCLVQPGHQYLVYQPDPGGFQLQVTAGSYHVEWFDPVTGQLTDGDRVTLPTGSQSFTPPASFTADAVLLLRAP